MSAVPLWPPRRPNRWALAAGEIWSCKEQSPVAKCAREPSGAVGAGPDQGARGAWRSRGQRGRRERGGWQGLRTPDGEGPGAGGGAAAAGLRAAALALPGPPVRPQARRARGALRRARGPWPSNLAVGAGYVQGCRARAREVGRGHNAPPISPAPAHGRTNDLVLRRSPAPRVPAPEGAGMPRPLGVSQPMHLKPRPCPAPRGSPRA